MSQAEKAMDGERELRSHLYAEPVLAVAMPPAELETKREFDPPSLDASSHGRRFCDFALLGFSVHRSWTAVLASYRLSRAAVSAKSASVSNGMFSTDTSPSQER